MNTANKFGYILLYHDNTISLNNLQTLNLRGLDRSSGPAWRSAPRTETASPPHK